MKPITIQQGKWLGALINEFLFLVKMTTIALVILTAVFIASQSSVAPVSTRLLGMYALEYATHKVKPYRVYFPQPYGANLKDKKR